MNVSASFMIVLNRALTAEDYISPGGYEVVDNNGNVFQFDFYEHRGYINAIDKRFVEFHLFGLDTDTYESSIDIVWEDIVGFSEFYVYLGEECERQGLEIESIHDFTIYKDNKEYHIEVGNSSICS